MAPPVIPSASMWVTIFTKDVARSRSAISWATASIEGDGGPAGPLTFAGAIRTRGSRCENPSRRMLSLFNDTNGEPRARRSEPLYVPRPSSPVAPVTATALLVRAGRVLLGRRTSTLRFAGMWDAFGGHLEPGETAEDALRRELSEELGVEVTGARSLGEYEDVDPTSEETFHHHLFLVTGWQGEPRIANEEHSEIRWFRPSEVDGLDLMPRLKAAIREELAGNP